MGLEAVIALAIVASAAAAFDAFCLVGLVRAEAVLRFSAEIWAFIILFFTPFGGMTYLTVGRPPR